MEIDSVILALHFESAALASKGPTRVW